MKKLQLLLFFLHFDFCVGNKKETQLQAVKSDCKKKVKNLSLYQNFLRMLSLYLAPLFILNSVAEIKTELQDAALYPQKHVCLLSLQYYMLCILSEDKH